MKTELTIDQIKSLEEVDFPVRKDEEGEYERITLLDLISCLPVYMEEAQAGSGVKYSLTMETVIIGSFCVWRVAYGMISDTAQELIDAIFKMTYRIYHDVKEMRDLFSN